MLAQNQTLTITTFALWNQLNEFRVESGGNKIQHGDFLARVEDECDDLGVSDFFPHPQNKQPVRFYNLTHEQSLLVGMRESKTVRKKVLDWLKLLESKSKPKIPTNFAEALQLAADQAKQLELAAPKVSFVDNLVDKKTLMTATQIAAKHKMSAIKLNKILDEIGGIYSKNVKRSRVFIQSFIDSGYGELKQTSEGYSQPLFTPAGELYIYEKLISEGVVN